MTTLRARLATAAAAGLLVVPTVAAQPAAASGCVTRPEYRSLPTNGTRTPAHVQGLFGATGRMVAHRVVRRADGTRVHWYWYRYAKCPKWVVPGQSRTVLVAFRQARAVDKRWL